MHSAGAFHRMSKAEERQGAGIQVSVPSPGGERALLIIEHTVLVFPSLRLPKACPLNSLSSLILSCCSCSFSSVFFCSSLLCIVVSLLSPPTGMDAKRRRNKDKGIRESLLSVLESGATVISTCI